MSTKSRNAFFENQTLIICTCFLLASGAFTLLLKATLNSAYEIECRNFHDFGGTDKLLNANHPDRPNGYSKSLLACPVAGCFE